MCMYEKYCGPEYGDDVEIVSGWATPLKFYCCNCKLHPERPGAGDFKTTAGQNEALALEQIMNHLCQHEQAGHKVHPSVGGRFCSWRQLYR